MAGRKNKWYLKNFEAKEKSLAKIMPKKTGLPGGWEMQNFCMGQAGMAYDILKMLEEDGVIDIGYIQDVISQWEPELWAD